MMLVKCATLATLVVLCQVLRADAIRTKPCTGNSKEYKENPNIIISNCDKLPCKLRRKTSANIVFKFTAGKDYQDVKNKVFAKIVGIPFPFLGVDGKSACDKIFEEGNNTKVGCPLMTGKKYEYRDHIDVLEIYPKLKTVVQWGLRAGNETILCFEVPARIV